MPGQYHFATEIPQTILDGGYVVDDSTGTVLTIGLKAPTRLRGRFLDRLSRMVAARITVLDGPNQESVELLLTRNTTSPQPRIALDNELHRLIRDVERGLRSISKHSVGLACDEACQEMWSSIVLYAHANIGHVVDSMKRSFQQNDQAYENMVTKLFRINDTEEAVDDELGDKLIQLHQTVDSYDNTLMKLLHLLEFTAEMLKRIDHLRQRLRSLLRRVQFADDICSLIRTLASPMYAYHTFVRTAQTYKVFEHVKFHLTPPRISPKKVSFARPSPVEATSTAGSSPPTKRSLTTRVMPPTRVVPSIATPQKPVPRAVRASPPRTSSSPPVPQRQEQLKNVAPNEIASHALSPTEEVSPVLVAARPYLLPADRTLRLYELQPKAKQDAAVLVGSILRKENPPPNSDAYEIFGYITCRDEDQLQRLGGLYQELLKEEEDKTAIFNILWRALETYSLVKLFDRYGYGEFREHFRSLEGFLIAPPYARPTVWRLVQFIRDQNSTEPLPCLQRDYGFKFHRQREEVLRVKAIYAQILERAHPLELHMACVHGQTFSFGKLKGVAIDEMNKRLMENDYPSPCLGYDNNQGLNGCEGRLFKRLQKF